MNMINAFPTFSTIKPEAIASMVEAILADGQVAIAQRLKQGAPYTWDNFILRIEEVNENVHQAWSPLQHLSAVRDTPAWREAYNKCVPKISAYATKLGQNVELYQAYQDFYHSSEFAKLDIAQQKVITNALRDFNLSGVTLAGEARERYQVIQQQLAQLHTQFEENILDATEAWQHHVTDVTVLTGLPAHAQESARAKAQLKDLAGWLVTLDQPSYLMVMQYVDDRALRKQIYYAYQTRASELSDDGRFDNTPLIKKILTLSAEKAHLLNFSNYAEYALLTNMASNTAEVVKFLRELAAAAKPFAQQELTELKKFAAQHGIDELQSWDLAYYSEKLRLKKFNIDAQSLRAYFPVAVVMEGMFAIIKHLYGMQVKEIKQFDRWHKDVKFFQIKDQDNTIRGHFYTDLYARDGKRSGAWMDAYRNRFKKASGLQTPIAYLTCNFSPAMAKEPPLLTHDEVITLFHEFGHCLQHLLTQINYPTVAGINGVAWDAVELASQFFENWCWHAETLPLISRHYQTGQPFSQDILTQLVAAKKFQVGMQTLQQVEFALFDIRLYAEFDANKITQVETILQAVRNEVSIMIPPVFTRFANGFAHIFAGGYAAGYYGYKWAEVLSADAFDRFLQEGVLNPLTGKQFLQAILETGGSQDAIGLFKQFRGREPQIAALLRQEGMKN